MTEETKDDEQKIEMPLKKTSAKKKQTSSKGSRKSNQKKTTSRAKASRPYPSISLEKCLIIAQKVKEKNGGNPWAPKEVQKAIGVGDTNRFYYYTAASRDFGITTGTRDSKEIAFTDFGREIFYAPNLETEKAKKAEAFFKVKIFKDVLEYYKGSTLPEMKYLSNTLEDKFKLNPEFHEEFSNIFSENCKYLNITTGSSLEETLGNTNKTTHSSTIIVGETKKTTKGKLKAFVIMPFTERLDKRPLGFFKEVLDSLIIPAGIEAEFTVETANKTGSDVIQSTIINDLLEADLVIADLTDHNPNVLFELGLRMAADLPIALIKTSDTGRIFDVDNMLRVYEYSQNLWKSTIDKDIVSLTEHFRSAWDNRNSEQTYMKILRRVATRAIEPF
jgi:hypothetical protein